MNNITDSEGSGSPTAAQPHHPVATNFEYTTTVQVLGQGEHENDFYIGDNCGYEVLEADDLFYKNAMNSGRIAEIEKYFPPGSSKPTFVQLPKKKA